jgi:hypothetical protein
MVKRPGKPHGRASATGRAASAGKLPANGKFVSTAVARAAKIARPKIAVRGSGLSRGSNLLVHDTPRSFREGVEHSLVEKVTALFRRSLKQMSVEEIQRAIAAPSPAATIVAVLNAAPEIGLARETATTRALARGAAAKQEMLQAAGGCLSSGDVARLLGKTVSAVNQRRARNQILAVPLSGGEWGFPASQFSSGDLRPGIAEIASTAGPMSPWVLLSILLDRVPGSEARIIDSLDDPEVMQDVLTRVRTYGEHGAS